MPEDPPPDTKDMLTHVIFKICVPFLDKVKRFRQAVVAYDQEQANKKENEPK